MGWIRVTKWTRDRCSLRGWMEHFESQGCKVMIKEKEGIRRKGDKVYDFPLFAVHMEAR